MENVDILESLEYKSLEYHLGGKIGTQIKKPLNKSKYFGYAYTPGVANPCLEIAKNAQNAYKYTSKCNSVVVVSDGTAVLGLGNIGAIAGKPVMEGKSLLFKYIAGIDATDLEIDVHESSKIAETVKAISPTYGGINLEDVAAPICFDVMKELEGKLQIPCFHDDQHGTAIVVASAVQNALSIVKKTLSNCKVVIIGAGAASIASINLLLNFGLNLKNLYVFDSKGLITKDRPELSAYKLLLAKDKKQSIQETLKDADIFIGLSRGNLLHKEDVKEMANNPIILAMANPVPEIMPHQVERTDAIIGTGRSDFPNQVNNVLCFPFIFRGALDVQAREITLNMQLACVEAIVRVSKQDQDFGPTHILPQPFNPLLLYEVSRAVAEAAIKDGVNNVALPENYEAYLENLVYSATIKADFIPQIGNSEASTIIDILKYRGIKNSSSKKLYSLAHEDIVLESIKSCTVITKTGCIGYNVESIITCSDIKKYLMQTDDYIGLILEDRILFNNNNRPWHANLLCRNI